MNPGEQVGPFVVVRRLGAGQMGVVYEVRRPDLDARYALKVLRRELCTSRDILRFQREVEQLAAVSTHPSVVPIHTAGEERGQLYYVMALIEGDSLQDRLARTGPLPPERAARYVRDLADALAALHRAGIVHRDIKPANVMLDGRDRALLTDFGLARSFVDERNRLTMTGELVGTPHFMAPEQALGHPVGPAADVYALGMVLYTLLAGRPAVAGKHMIEVLTQVGSGEFVPLPELAPTTPRAIVDVTHACLSLDPADRPEAAALRAALDEFLRRPQREEEPPSYRGWVAGLAGAAALAVALAGVALARRPHGSPDVADVPSAVAPVATGREAAPQVAHAEPPPPAAPWLAALRASALPIEELEAVATRLEADVASGALSAADRAQALRLLRAMDARWRDPRPDPDVVLLGGDLATKVAHDFRWLVCLHSMLRQLDPAHEPDAVRSRLLQPDGTVTLIVAPKLSPLGPTFARRYVSLFPDAVNVYVIYADFTRDVWRYRAEIDTALLGRGLEVADRQDRPAAWARVAKALGELYRYTGAEADLVAIGDAAVARSKASPEVRKVAIELLYTHVGFLLDRDRIEEALLRVDLAFEVDPASLEARLARHLVHMKAFRLTGAGASRDAALAAAQEFMAQSERADTWQQGWTLQAAAGLGELQRDLGNIEDGLAAVEKALSIEAVDDGGTRLVATAPNVAVLRVALIARLDPPDPQRLARALREVVLHLDRWQVSYRQWAAAAPHALPRTFEADLRGLMADAQARARDVAAGTLDPAAAAGWLTKHPFIVRQGFYR